MSQWITPDIKTEKRDSAKELDAIFAADKKYAPQTYALESQYGPLYNRLNIANLAEGAYGYNDASGQHIPGQLELARDATSQQRSADIADVEQYGSRAVAASLDANPYLARSLGLLQQRSDDSPLLRSLNQQAQAGLASGGQLSAQELRESDQASRAGFADRGLLNSNQSVASDILSRDAAVRQRLAGAQQFAGQVQGMNQAQNAFVGNVAQVSGSSLADPFMSVLSRPGTAVGQLQPTQGTRAFQPFDAQNYLSDLFTYNANAQNARNIALSNAQANTRSSIATVASSFSDLRLKENVAIVGHAPSGLLIIEFNYNRLAAQLYGMRRSRRYRGAIAQDVERIQPAAVTTDARGYKSVDYSLIDVRMEEITVATFNCDHCGDTRWIGGDPCPYCHYLHLLPARSWGGIPPCVG